MASPCQLPAHCPRAHHVTLHTQKCATVADLAALPVAAAAGVGKSFVAHRAVGGALLAQARTALTVEAKFAPSGKRPAPKRFFTVDRATGLTTMPRMAWLQLGVRPGLDKRVAGRPLPTGTAYTNADGGLFPFQETVVDAMVGQLDITGGAMVVAPCGMGKSEMICALIAACGVRAVVSEPKCHLARMIAESIGHRLPMLKVRILDGSHPARRITPDVDVIVTVNNSAAKADEALFADVGLWINDEAHHGPAAVAVAAMARSRSRRVAGFTATPYRSDGCHVVLPHIFGPTVASVRRPWMPVVVRQLVFRGALREAASYGDAIKVLSSSASWLAMAEAAVLQVAARVAARGGRVLVLVDRLRLTMEMCDRFEGAQGVSAAQWERLRKYETDRATGEQVKACTPDFSACAQTAAELQAHPLTASLFVGVTQTPTERARAQARRTAIVFSTSGMAYEGLNLRNIHAVCLFAKPSRPQQHVGRGLRITSMAAVPEFIFTAEPDMARLAKNRSDQLAYFSDFEGWPVEQVAASQATKVLAANGSPPTQPTPAYWRKRLTASQAAELRTRIHMDDEPAARPRKRPRR